MVLLAWKRKLSSKLLYFYDHNYRGHNQYNVIFIECGNDSDFAKAKPRRKKARSTVHNVVNNNPIYEGAVYETAPGESFKPLLISSSAPSLNGAGSAPNYHDTPTVLNLPPSIPTDRECVQPYLVPMNEVERIKTSIKQAELSQRSQCGDEYMVMGSNNPKDSNFEKMPLSEGSVAVSEMAVSGHDSEDAYVTLH